MRTYDALLKANPVMATTDTTATATAAHRLSNGRSATDNPTTPIAATTAVMANRNVEVRRSRNGYLCTAEIASISGNSTARVMAVAGLPSQNTVMIPAMNSGTASHAGPRPKMLCTAVNDEVMNSKQACRPLPTG